VLIGLQSLQNWLQCLGFKLKPAPIGPFMPDSSPQHGPGIFFVRTVNLRVPAGEVVARPSTYFIEGDCHSP
jgi:hypothetical protein